MQAYVLIKCNTGSEAKIISEFKEIPEVSEINGIWGKHDIFLNVLTRDPQFIDELVKKIRKHPDVTDTYTMHVLYGQAKVEHSLNLLEELSRFYESVDFVKIRKSAEKENLFLLGIMKNRKKQDISKSIKQLMTYEGRIARIYHENLTTIFHQLISDAS